MSEKARQWTDLGQIKSQKKSSFQWTPILSYDYEKTALAHSLSLITSENFMATVFGKMLLKDGDDMQYLAWIVDFFFAAKKLWEELNHVAKITSKVLEVEQSLECVKKTSWVYVMQVLCATVL